MNNWWNTEERIQSANYISELNKKHDDLGLNDHFSNSSQDVRQSIVRINQNFLGVMSLLDSANKQLRTIRRICVCILLVLILILLK